MAEPLCKYFGKCGGCTGQHVDYKLQVENKTKMLFNAIKKKDKDFKIEDIKAFFDNEYHYRNRMDFIFHINGIGFREKGNWRKINDIDECVISNKRLNELLKEARGFFKSPDAFDVVKHSGTLKYAVIRTPQNDSSISFVLNSDSSRLNDAQEKIKEFAKITSADNVIITMTPAETDVSVTNEYFVVKGRDMLSETYLGKRFEYHVQGFFQNNSVMAEKMHEYVNGILKKHHTSSAHLLDLYGGVGTFGIINAELFKSVTIVEEFKGCIETAEVNIKNNNINNAKAIAMDAKHLKKLSFGSPLFVITDPPRSGMHPNTIHQLKELQPKVIIYVSCNVEQLGKDLLKFKDYKIKSAAMFDLFPQTLHCEGVVELVRC